MGRPKQITINVFVYCIVHGPFLVGKQNKHLARQLTKEIQ